MNPNRAPVTSLPPEVQAQIGYKERRFIQSNPDTNDKETLDRRQADTFLPS